MNSKMSQAAAAAMMAIAIAAQSIAAQSTAATYWLDAAATGTGDGLSRENAFTTWETAFSATGGANGNLLNVLPGTYTLATAPATWGTSRNDVTIQGVDADGHPLASAQAAASVVVDGAGLGTIAPIRASFRTTITGITFRNGKGAASTGAAIHLTGTGISGVTIQGLTVSNCVFEACTGGPAVYSAAIGGDNFEGCVFSRNANSAGNATALHKYNSSGVNPLSVKNCTFIGNDGSGSSGDGKGVAVYATRSVDFADCTFASNTNTARGVALYLYCAGASNRFDRCVFTGNANVKSVASAGLDGSGGVLYVGQGNSTNVFSNCAFEGNSANGGGGCVMLRMGRLVAEDCTFDGNTAAHGTAVASSYDRSGASASFVRCTLSGNTAAAGSIVTMGTACGLSMTDCEVSGNTYSTCGVSSITADSTIDRCVFRANTTPASETSDSNAKAALLLTAGTAANCLVACNTNLWTGSSAAGVSISGGTLKNCTVVGNHSVGTYPGVSSASCTIVNTAICGNTGTGAKIVNMSCYGYCVCDGTANSDTAWNNRPGNRIVEDLADYGFADAVKGDYTLKGTSPLRNAGDNGVWSGIDALDLAGMPRVNAEDMVNGVAVVDIGCHEWYGANKATVILMR